MDEGRDRKIFKISLLHFITAGLILSAFVFVFCAIFYGDLLPVVDEKDEFVGYVVAFVLMSLLCSGVVALLTVPSFIVSGCKLRAQSCGKSCAGKSFIVTFVLKIIALCIMLYGLIYMVGLIYMREGTASSIITVVLHGVAILFGLFSSVLEVWVRRTA